MNGWGIGSGSNPFNPSTDPDSDDGSGTGNSSSSGSGSSSGTDSGSNSESGSGSGTGSGGVDIGNNGGINYGGDIGGDGGFSPGFGTGSNGFNNNGLDYERLVFYRQSHGLLASLAFAFFFPLGAIVVRLARGRYTVLAHGATQLIAYALYVAAAGLGLYLVTMVPAVPVASGSTSRLAKLSTNAHPIIGIVLLVVLLSQPLWGVLHHRRFSRLKRRTWVSHVHIWIGRASITLGIVNGGLGLVLAAETGSPAAASYTGVSVFMWTLWVLAVVVGEYRAARARREKQAKRAKIIREDRGCLGDVRRGGASRRDESPPPPPGENDEAADGHSHSLSPDLSRSMPAAVTSDMPSPPYYQGPHYEAHMAHLQRQRQQQRQQRRRPQQQAHWEEDLRNIKEALEMSDSVSVTSASPDEMHRGQV